MNRPKISSLIKEPKKALQKSLECKLPNLGLRGIPMGRKKRSLMESHGSEYFPIEIKIN